MLGFKLAASVFAVLNFHSREAASDAAESGLLTQQEEKGLGFPVSLTHLHRDSLLPAAPLVATWHQHTRQSIPSMRNQDKRGRHPAPKG